MLLIALFQFVIPLFLLSVLAFGRQPSRLRWLLNAVAFGLVIGFMYLSSRWDIVSLYYRMSLPFLYLLACFIGYRSIRAPKKMPGRIQVMFAYGLTGVMLVLMIGLNVRVLMGYQFPEGASDLASPLRNGKFVVLSGGTSPFINAHAKIRPQQYALDILGLTSAGRHINSLGGSTNLNDYPIFGAVVYSPCNGSVLAIENGLIDLIPPATDTTNPAGNYVLLACDGFEVLLAHMQEGSVKVGAGDAVNVNTRLGLVGNSGNTSEPHLHIHAERGGEPATILNGDSVPITIDGRFLVRGDVIG